MQRCQRLERLDLGQRGGIYQHRRGHVGATMHDAVAEPDQPASIQRTIRQRGEQRQRGRMIFRDHRPVMQHLAVGRGDSHTALAADAFDLAALQSRQCIAAGTVHGEFQTRGTGVQYRTGDDPASLLAFHVRSVHGWRAHHRRAPETASMTKFGLAQSIARVEDPRLLKGGRPLHG